MMQNASRARRAGRPVARRSSHGAAASPATLALRAALLLAIAAALAGCRGRLETVTLRVGHRMYANFADTVTVRLGERFQIGDTQFTGEIDRFIPDFAMEEKEAVSRSDEIKNPAVHVKVYDGGSVIEESWAFPGRGAPHVKGANFLYFVITDMEIAPEEGAVGERQDAVEDSAGAQARTAR